MATFVAARNDRSGLYEVHAQECFHLRSPSLDVCPGTYEAPTGQQVAIEFEQANEGCLAALGPCAKAGAVNEKARRKASLEGLW